MKRCPKASVRKFRRHRAGNQGDEAPPPGPPTLFSVPDAKGRVTSWDRQKPLPA